MTRLFPSITHYRLVASNVEATASICVIKICLVYILSWKRDEVFTQVDGSKVLQFLRV